MLRQDNGRVMPHWKDLSAWMKVMIATLMGHEWDLLTFNINLHPDLEDKLVQTGDVRGKMRERINLNIRRAMGAPREFFFVIEGHSKTAGIPTRLHLHGAVCAHDRSELVRLEDFVRKAVGQSGANQVPRSVHTRWFETIRVAYVDYLFKFAKRFDGRLEERRLAMSLPMTQAAQDFWRDISRERDWD